MSDHEWMNLWRLAGRLSVRHAALLIADVNPAEVAENFISSPAFAIFHALKNDILANRLRADLAFRPEVPNTRGDEDPNIAFTFVLSSVTHVEKLRGMPSPDADQPLRLQTEPDWSETTVDVNELKAWCRSKGQFPRFLFPGEGPPDFMNPADLRYSPKLACAVAAWTKVTQNARNKSVKQTIEEWVRKNAESFGIVDKQNNVPKTAVEEIAKIVNWAPEGGATPSGGGQVANTSPPPPPTPAQNFEPFRKDQVQTGD